MEYILDEDLEELSRSLLEEAFKLNKFESKYDIFPYQEAESVFGQMILLASLLPDIKHPKNTEELVLSELKRRLYGDAFLIEQRIGSKQYNFETVISIYDIPKEDIDGLENWLVENRDQVLEIIQRSYQEDNMENYELDLDFDIPWITKRSNEFAANNIDKYHNTLGDLLQKLTKVGSFLSEIDAFPTTDEFSYFNSVPNFLALSIQKICYMTKDRELHLRERKLIELYGHEAMGHALNKIITKINNFPYFITDEAFLTKATKESVSQFYQKVILEDLKDSPETQKKLGIHDRFEEIYQESKNMAKIAEYRLKFCQYSITVLADKEMGEQEDQSTVDKKIERLNEVTLDPLLSMLFVEENRFNFDSQGNLGSELVSELMYCAQPVQRAIKIFGEHGILYTGEGRSIIDSAFLKGFWTPTGFEQNARLIAESYNKK